MSWMSRYGNLKLPKPEDGHWEEVGIRPPWLSIGIVFYRNYHIGRRGLAGLVVYSLRKRYPLFSDSGPGLAL